MKFVLVPILMLLIATQAFGKWVILLEFKLNKDHITKNLCENRTEPQMKCGGKCQLMKAMKNEEPPTNQSQNIKSHFQEILFCNENVTETYVAEINKSSLSNTPYLTQHYSSPLRSIFHPPQC